ncbi:MAG: adenylate/guanylate cyclase domain-containing protein [Pseudomonadota bacterium]
MKPLRAAALIAISAALFVGLWRPSDQGGFFSGFEARLLDVRFAIRGPKAPPADVAILAIDNDVLAEIGDFPPSREVIAQAIERAFEAGARVVALDLMLVDARDGDDVFSDVVSRNAPVILPVSITASAKKPDDDLTRALAKSAFALIAGETDRGPDGVIGPVSDFLGSVHLGHVNVGLEADGALRRIPAGLSQSDQLILPALPLKAARLHKGLSREGVVLKLGETLSFGRNAFPLDDQNALVLNYLGSAGTVPTFPLTAALGPEASLPFSGKTVFIGATAQGFGDRFATPYDIALPGVEALATLTQNILSNDVLRRDALTWVFDILLGCLAAAGAVWAASRMGLVVGGTALVAAWGATFGVIQIGFLSGLWLDGVTAVFALLLGSLCGFTARFLAIRKRSQNLARYQSPLLAETLAQNQVPAFDGRNQKAAALFVDAAGFSGLSETLGADRTASFLRAFHAVIEHAATACGGTVEQFAGDGAMIIFGLPEPHLDDAANALKCCNMLFDEIRSLGKGQPETGVPAVTIRVGAHYGDVVAAVLGGERHQHVTVTGPIVNAASRLQEVAKAEGADMVISEDLLNAAGEPNIAGLKPLGPRNLRGLREPLTLWAHYAEQTREETINDSTPG